VIERLRSLRLQFKQTKCSMSALTSQRKFIKATVMSGSCQSRRFGHGQHFRFHPYERTSSDLPSWSVSCQRRHHRSPRRLGRAAWRHAKAERLCSLEVDDQLELGWQQRPQVFRLGPRENAARIGSGADDRSRDARTVADEPACLHEFTNVVHGRYVPTRRARDNFGGLLSKKGSTMITSALAWIAVKAASRSNASATFTI